MPTYEPIDTGDLIRASPYDLLTLQWQTNGISADFILRDDDAHILRVLFGRPCIVRILDEMSLSTEEDETPDEGLVNYHFAYRLKGSRFALMQSEMWKETMGPVSHYRFITGWACVDVLSGGAPSFSVVARAE